MNKNILISLCLLLGLISCGHQPNSIHANYDVATNYQPETPDHYMSALGDSCRRVFFLSDVADGDDSEISHIECSSGAEPNSLKQIRAF